MPVENLPNRGTTSYGVSRQIIHKSGLIPMPAAGPKGTPTTFARIHAPYEYEIVSWTAECEGGLPVLPSPYGPTSENDPTPNPLGLNANRVLISASPVATLPIPLGNGNHKFLCSGTYVYGAVQPAGPTAEMKLGKWPYEQHKKTENYIPATAYSTGVLDTSMVPPLYPLDPPLENPLLGP